MQANGKPWHTPCCRRAGSVQSAYLDTPLAVAHLTRPTLAVVLLNTTHIGRLNNIQKHFAIIQNIYSKSISSIAFHIWKLENKCEVTAAEIE